ncbi:G patch domain-containing protein 1 [Megachile rotundata]|uniref:G patch domain-containing protein 1 n=1 Tax=Megachile rotundata TaxID=143995 RepID=UPI000614E7E8|nr:PREDICTED: G patch domain-containing protein 1 [Megachile rotundata]XP_012140180.1 PREDICTED: G patch domain-containing protein 1 [Megachile rotundata]
MSDSEDENYVSFGVPLDPLDEDNLPRKKPVTIEEQCAYDAQGRRRFHGAFTGGFSAGYFNTVGTRDGWRPQQFKSSRSSKAESITQRPEDFMDDEDTGEFGIAPKGICATSDYTDHGHRGIKRERVNRESSGPIPGTPVLKDLLKPVKETVGIMLLKKMGWRPGQGIGSRLTKQEKAKIKSRNAKMKILQQESKKANSESSSEESEDDYGDVTFAPDDYEPFRCNPKDNYFGIGYSGLDRRTILSGHVNLFDTPAFSVQDKNKKLSIHGQAFGVGAFEADDEDIYEREDMSRYDFALGPERKTKTRWSAENSLRNLNDNCLEGFALATAKLQHKKIYPPPDLPKDFVPVHAVRKSRFYPPTDNIPRAMENGKRKELTAADRARILEDSNSSKKPSESYPNSVPSVASNIITKVLNLHGKQETKERQKEESQRAKAATSWMDKLNAQSFVKGGTVGLSKDSEGSLKNLEEFKDSFSASDEQKGTNSSNLKEDNSANKSTVKPFLSDPDKQRRFEQYLVFSNKGEKNKLESIQPLSMTEWDREHERVEFEQAAKLFVQPINDYVTNKFTHASEHTSASSDASSTKYEEENEMKQAVKMKMFGKLTRERIDWKPASIVCKRFNIPEPQGGCAQPELQKKTAKFSIFDSIDWSNSTKFLRASDTVSKETKPADTPKEESINSTNSDIKSNSNIPFSSQILEPVSEKMKNFEASYEKVFGKEVQETFSKVAEVEETTSKFDSSTTSETAEKQARDDESASIIKSKSEEKKDLFKAIFLSSSEESESEPEESMDSEAVKSVLIGKVPSEVNVNRNTSPPRGIFAKVDLDSLIADPRSSAQANETKEKETILVSDSESKQINDADSNPPDIELLPDMYGPALPSRLLKNEPPTPEASSSQTFKPVFKSVVVAKPKTDSKISGVWVERTKVKKSKKEKKKHKHKEHKSSKHKRKSKKEKRGS